MKRIGMCLFLFVLTSLCTTSALAQDKTPRDRLLVAHGQYYTPTTSGLKSFHCEASIDWKTMLKGFTGSEMPDDDPVLKYLQTVHLSIEDQLNGAGSMEWTETGVPPEGKEAGMKQMRSGLQRTMVGFFQSWNGYMNGTMVPLPGESTELSTTDSGVHLREVSDSTKLDEEFDKNMLLTRVIVDTPDIKVVAIPTYVKTDDGLIISEVVSQLNQPPTAPPVEVTFRVTYAKVGAFQIPSHVVYYVKNVGGIEVSFNNCQVTVADPPQKPAAEKPNSPTN
jgi:hypothetical protein